MGEVIRKTASRDEIIADVRRALTNAQGKGGKWKELAEQQLSPTFGLLDSVEQQLGQTGEALGTAEGELKGRHDDANAMLGRVADDIWNDVGRPASDPALALLFPGGVTAYTRGNVSQQPDRMELLAQLLEKNGHPRLTPDQAKAHAQRVRDGAVALRAAVAAEQGPATGVKMLQKVQRAVVLSAQAALANLKRLYKIAGFSEAEIHTVIPDRPLAGRPQPTPAASPDPSPAAKSLPPVPPARG